MPSSLHTSWQGADLAILRGEDEIDRIAGPSIRRVILVYTRGGESPGDLAYAVVETADDHVLLPAESGIAGRVHFERQGFWQDRPRIYWIGESKALLPRRLRPGIWLFRRQRPGYLRLPCGELQPVLDRWPLEGPQSWEQRKWERIVRTRLLAPLQER